MSFDYKPMFPTDAGRIVMNDQELHRLRDMLLARRRDLLGREKNLEAGWDDLKQVAIELEEDAQKLSITEPFDRLDEEGKDEIEQIDLALKKMPLGDYGICEGCGDEISLKRLETIPWTRLCIECAREYEKEGLTLQDPSEVVTTAPLPDDETVQRPGSLPDEYEGLSDDQIVAIIMKQIKQDGRIDTEEMEISLSDGVLYLEGVIASVPEHQILMQTLTDVLGFSSIVDHLKIDEVLWERKDRTPKRAHERVTLKDRLFYDEENLTEDLFQAEHQDDDTPYSPPEKPLPHQEGEPTGG
jgi:DnaK suppressor protein